MLEYRTGRLINHIHLRARDFAAARRFYAAVFGALGIPISGESDDHLWCDEFFLDALGSEDAAATHIHLAFQAPDRDAVMRFHRAGLAAGGTDNGAPGERPYHSGYYAAFLLDPDGNNIEAVHPGPALRSAESITIRLEDGGAFADKGGAG